MDDGFFVSSHSFKSIYQQEYLFGLIHHVHDVIQFNIFLYVGFFSSTSGNPWKMHHHDFL